MRKPVKHRRKPWPFRLRVALTFFWIAAGAIAFNGYVDTEIRPTLMRLAEYEARSITTQTIHTAAEDVLSASPDLYTNLYRITDTVVQMDATAANMVQTTLVQAVQRAVNQISPQECVIPFGSLTGNSLLSGHGPGWKVEWKPEGYVQAEWQETTQSLAINTTRYSVDLAISVTVNMILDGRSETVVVTEKIPLCSLLWQGDTPQTYAHVAD